MPPIWVHFFFALAFCVLVSLWARKYRPESPFLPFLIWGIMWGSVGPDADLLVASAASLATGFDTSSGKFIHRTVTHGLPLVGLLLVAGALLWLAKRPRAGPFVVGLGVGVGVFHIVPDLFYLVPLKFLAPFSFAEFGPYALGGRHFWLSDFNDVQNNVINGLDFAGDSLIYLATWALARRFGVETRFTRILPWFALANALVFLPLVVFVAPRVSYDTFLIYAYAPGVVFIAVSTLFVPWKARAVFQRLPGAA